MKIPKTNIQERRVRSGTGLPQIGSIENQIGSREKKPGSREKGVRWIRIALAIFILMVSGCIRIPEESWIVSHRSPFETHRQTAKCSDASLDPSTPDRIGPGRITQARTVRSTALNAGGFSLMSWNIFKGNKEGWAKDFQKFSRDTDILILQEAYLTDSLKEMLQQEQYQWVMTVAFEYRQIEAGVLTAARTTPNFTCTFREKEPITRIPKSALITRYPFMDRARELLVVNLHAINFTVDTSAFQKQLDRLEIALAAYRGPLIVSGDFNTWNTARMACVNAMAKRLDLTAVRFDENRRSRFFGHPTDHVYYRALEVINATIPMVSTSDHNPLRVVFKLAEEPAPSH